MRLSLAGPAGLLIHLQVYGSAGQPGRTATAEICPSDGEAARIDAELAFPGV